MFAGRALTDGYIAHVAASVAECFDLYCEQPEPPRVSDDKIRAAFFAFDGLARKKERAVSPSALANTVKQRARISTEEYGISRLILEELGLISVSDRGIITVSRNKTDLTQSAVYRNVRQK